MAIKMKRFLLLRSDFHLMLIVKFGLATSHSGQPNFTMIIVNCFLFPLFHKTTYLVLLLFFSLLLLV